MELWLLDQNTNIRQTLHVDADSIVIGRDSDCDVVLKGPFVAKRHARITRKGNQFFVDNVSRSGCRVANRDVLPGTPQRIDFGDEVQIAQFSLALIRPDDKRNLDKNTDRRELQKLLMTYEQQVHALQAAREDGGVERRHVPIVPRVHQLAHIVGRRGRRGRAVNELALHRGRGELQQAL